MADPTPTPPVAPKNPVAAVEAAVVKMPWFWLKDDTGRKSITATVVMIAFLATTLNYLLSFLSPIFGHDFKVFDTAACSTYMIPVISMYVGRKLTDRHYDSKDTATMAGADTGDSK